MLQPQPELHLPQQGRDNTTPLDKEFGIKFGTKFGTKFGDNEKRVLLLLASHPDYTAQNIADRIEVTKRTVEKILKRLRENYIIERVGSNKTGHWKILSINSRTSNSKVASPL